MTENPFEQKSGMMPPEHEPIVDPREYMEKLKEGGHVSIPAEEREKRIADLMAFRKIPRVKAEQLIDEQIMADPDMTRLHKESEKKAKIDPELAKMKVQQEVRKKAWKERKGERDTQI